MNNPHLGADVLKYLDSIVPNTPELQLVGEQEAMRVMFTQMLIDTRLSSGMTHEQIAFSINKDVEWVKHVEDCNYSHTWDDFVTYMHALGAEFEIKLNLPNGSNVKLSSDELKRSI